MEIKCTGFRRTAQVGFSWIEECNFGIAKNREKKISNIRGQHKIVKRIYAVRCYLHNLNNECRFKIVLRANAKKDKKKSSRERERETLAKWIQSWYRLRENWIQSPIKTRSKCIESRSPTSSASGPILLRVLGSVFVRGHRIVEQTEIDSDCHFQNIIQSVSFVVCKSHSRCMSVCAYFGSGPMNENNVCPNENVCSIWSWQSSNIRTLIVIYVPVRHAIFVRLCVQIYSGRCARARKRCTDMCT